MARFLKPGIHAATSGEINRQIRESVEAMSERFDSGTAG
jgi:hypothetical protein